MKWGRSLVTLHPPPPPLQPQHILLIKVMIRMKSFGFSFDQKTLKILFQMLFPTKGSKLKFCCWTVSVVLMLKLNLSQMQYISESSKISLCWGWSGGGGGEVLGDSPSPLQPQHILQKNDDKNENIFFCWFKKSLKFYSKCFFQPNVWKKNFAVERFQ